MPTVGCAYCKEVAMTTLNLVAVAPDDRPRYFCGLWRRRRTGAAGEASRLTKGREPVDKSLPGVDLEGAAAAPDGHRSTGGVPSRAPLRRARPGLEPRKLLMARQLR